MYRKVSLVPTHTLISATAATHVRHILNTRTQMHTGQQTEKLRWKLTLRHTRAYIEAQIWRERRRKRMGMKEQRQRAL